PRPPTPYALYPSHRYFYSPASFPADIDPMRPGFANTPFRVSALVSTYKGERFIRGCLEDLVAQTLFSHSTRGIAALEILVINSGSPEGEDRIICEFAARSPDRFTYIHTQERETLYAAWNRALRAARGNYLTNANVDDRHHPEALERMANTLDCAP